MRAQIISAGKTAVLIKGKQQVLVPEQARFKKELKMIEINDYTRKIVSTKTTLMLGKCGIGVKDLEDIEQELYLELLKKSKNYNPEKGRTSTFVQCILQNKISEILSRKKKELVCRTFTECGFFSDDIDEAQFIDQSHLIDREDLSIDVRDVADSLTPELRVACKLLARGESVTEVARRLGLKRSTFYYRVLNTLNKALMEKGLQIYVENF